MGCPSHDSCPRHDYDPALSHRIPCCDPWFVFGAGWALGRETPLLFPLSSPHSSPLSFPLITALLSHLSQPHCDKSPLTILSFLLRVSQASSSFHSLVGIFWLCHFSARCTGDWSLLRLVEPAKVKIFLRVNCLCANGM